MKGFEKYINELSDDDNPAFVFRGVNTSILTKIVNKRIDPVRLAELELYNRGFDKNGKWLKGPDNAKKYWKVKPGEFM